MATIDRACDVISAQLFFEGKIKEFEAACFGRDRARLQQAEEDCRSALTALLDAKRMQSLQIIRDAGRN
jgi:hypothetical protein